MLLLVTIDLSNADLAAFERYEAKALGRSAGGAHRSAVTGAPHP